MKNLLPPHKIIHYPLSIIHFFITFATSFVKPNEKRTQVDRDSGTHTHSAVHHTRRTALSAARTELGGTESGIYRL